MSIITYTGIFQENRQVFSTYLIGYIPIRDLRNLYNEVGYDNVHMLEEEIYQAHLETMIVKRYIKKEIPLLWAWLKEMKIPFGGIVPWKDVFGGKCAIKFLLLHHTQEDLAFRLCYNVKMEES